MATIAECRKKHTILENMAIHGKIWDIVNLDDEKWLSNINSAAAEIGCGHIASLPRRRRGSMQQLWITLTILGAMAREL